MVSPPGLKINPVSVTAPLHASSAPPAASIVTAAVGAGVPPAKTIGSCASGGSVRVETVFNDRSRNCTESTPWTVLSCIPVMTFAPRVIS